MKYRLAILCFILPIFGLAGPLSTTCSKALTSTTPIGYTEEFRNRRTVTFAKTKDIGRFILWKIPPHAAEPGMRGSDDPYIYFSVGFNIANVGTRHRILKSDLAKGKIVDGYVRYDQELPGNNRETVVMKDGALHFISDGPPANRSVTTIPKVQGLLSSFPNAVRPLPGFMTEEQELTFDGWVVVSRQQAGEPGPVKSFLDLTDYEVVRAKDTRGTDVIRLENEDVSRGINEQRLQLASVQNKTLDEILRWTNASPVGARIYSNDQFVSLRYQGLYDAFEIYRMGTVTSETAPPSIFLIPSVERGLLKDGYVYSYRREGSHHLDSGAFVRDSVHRMTVEVIDGKIVLTDEDLNVVPSLRTHFIYRLENKGSLGLAGTSVTVEKRKAGQNDQNESPQIYGKLRYEVPEK